MHKRGAPAEGAVLPEGVHGLFRMTGAAAVISAVGLRICLFRLDSRARAVVMISQVQLAACDRHPVAIRRRIMDLVIAIGRRVLVYNKI